MWFYHDVVLSCNNQGKDKIHAKLFPKGASKAPAQRVPSNPPEVEMVDVVHDEEATTGVKIDVVDNEEATTGVKIDWREEEGGADSDDENESEPEVELPDNENEKDGDVKMTGPVNPNLPHPLDLVSFEKMLPAFSRIDMDNEDVGMADS